MSPPRSTPDDELYPSGPWVGYYLYAWSHVRNRQELTLTFRDGQLQGDGLDGVGAFLIRGAYDRVKGEVWWTKSYPGGHDVFYRGFREGKGIWGTWEIPPLGSGGFKIWPRGLGDAEALHAVEDVEAPSRVGVGPVGRP